MLFLESHEDVELGGAMQRIKVAHFRLAYSRQMFVVAYPRETQEMVLDAHVRAVEFFGGVPARLCQSASNTFHLSAPNTFHFAGLLRLVFAVFEAVRIDNPKAMIADANRYEPRSNDTVLDFARHYGTSILPARPRHPQDKPKVESAVQIVERWILARLRHQSFGSVHEVNMAIAGITI